MSVVGPRPMVADTYAHYSQEAQEILNSVRPGLTGLGSIIFRDKESLLDQRDDPVSFYTCNITPYKSALEVWFVENNCLSLYFKLIMVTAWVVIVPSSSIVDRIFNDIPVRPKILSL